MNPPSDEVNPYLEQEVFSASPLRLRWMLIQRAEELCGEVKRLWECGEDNAADGWLLRIREILGELLGGIQDEKNPVSQPVADFYVFLLQLLTQVEFERDPSKLETLKDLLHLENETWEKVVHHFQSSDFQTSDLREFDRQKVESLGGNSLAGKSPGLPLLQNDPETLLESGGFNLEV